MTLLYVIHIPQEESQISDYWELLSESEKVSADRFVRYADKLCFVVTRASLRTLIGTELDLDPGSLEIDYAPKGKPKLSLENPDSLFFNASHSGEYSLIALNREHEIGVDIERKREIRNLDGLAARFFTEVEYQEFRDSDDEVAAFFSIWTLKEAIVKLTGKGISGGLSTFDVSLISKNDSHLTRLENTETSINEVSLSPFDFNSKYAAALASASPSNPYAIREYSRSSRALHRA